MKLKYKNRIYNQELFLGNNKKENYFEGWYFKHVTNNKKNTISFIPGISKTKNDEHAFIQIIDNIQNKSYYIKYNIQDFSYSHKPFFIKIKNNYFSLEKIYININKEIKIKAKLNYKNITPIKKDIYSPNIMGPFAYLTFMECNHSIISLKHDIKGYINIYNQKLDYNGGIGYIEKDYGSSFPDKYLWLQSNTPRTNTNSSLFLSIARIPFKKLKFTGLIALLQIKNKQYRFATYYFAKIIKFECHKNYYLINIRQGKFKLFIKVIPSAKINLISPQKGKMKNKIFESLDSTISVKLLKDNKEIFKEEYIACGSELVGY